MAYPVASFDASLMPASAAPIIAAKEMAVEQYLAPKSGGARFRAYGVSPNPRENVRGVGIGPRLAGHGANHELCVRLYVERRIPSTKLSPGMALPREIGGIPTDVIESGRFYAYHEVAQRDRLRPAQPGCSIGVQFPGEDYPMTGTFGAVVKNAQGTCYILSNNHVLAGENRLKLGTEIFQPSYLDHRHAEPIARLAEFVELTTSSSNAVDCAIAEVADPKLVSAVFLPAVDRLSDTAPGEPAMGLRVEKVGRSSGHTTGQIIDLNFDARIEYASGTFMFQNQLLVRGDYRIWQRVGETLGLSRSPRTTFSEPGDSGAVVVDRSHKVAVGLLLGGSDAEGDFSIVSPIGRALDAFGVTIAV